MKEQNRTFGQRGGRARGCTPYISAGGQGLYTMHFIVGRPPLDAVKGRVPRTAGRQGLRIASYPSSRTPSAGRRGPR